MIVNIEQIDPFSLLSVTFEKRAELPIESGIYFVILDTKILYIGKSINLRNRWAGHHRAKQFNALGDIKIAWFTPPNLEEGDLEELEEICIEHFSPPFNGEVIPDRFAVVDPALSLLGEKIKQNRKQRGITGEQMGKAIGVSKSCMEAIEQGRCDVKFTIIVKIAKLLKIPVEDFFNFPDVSAEPINDIPVTHGRTGNSRDTTIALPMLFGLRLKQLRHEIGLTEEDLAKEAELTLHQINLMEQGRGLVRIDALKKLAKVLRIPNNELFDFSELVMI